MAETGLQRHMEMDGEQRHSRGAASLHSSDDATSRLVGRATQVRILVEMWLALSGASACVLIGECIVGGWRSGSR